MGPLQVHVLKHAPRSTQAVASLARPASFYNGRGINKREQCGIAPESACNMYIFRATLEYRVTSVSHVSDNPEAFSIHQPRMSLLDKIQSQFGLFSICKTLWFDFCLWWPPEPDSEWQAKHPVADARKAYHQTIMLPTRPTNRSTTVLVQSIVNDRKDLCPFGNQGFHQDSEKTTGYQIQIPSTFYKKSVNGGKVFGIMESHSKNHLANRVFSHAQGPSDQQRQKNPITRSSETLHESDVVNSERMWYLFFQVGVPPSP